MKKNKSFFPDKAVFIFMTAVLIFASTTVVCSQMVTPNIRINDADADNIVTGSKSLAVVGDNIYVVWADDRVEAGNIYFSKSVDGGETFSDDIMLSGPNNENLNMWPAIVADENGGVYVTWVGFTKPYMEGEDVGVNVWFTRSTNEGDSFDTPIQVTENDFSIFPSIGVYENYVYLFYGYAETFPYANFFLVRSTDGGSNFHDPIQVNDAENIEEIAFDNFTSLDIDPLTGHVYLAWIDGRREDSKGDIFFAKSTDNGANISDNTMVNGAETNWADFEMMNPKISVGEENMVYVGFVVEDDDDARAILAISDDNGNSFAMESLLADNDNYCYHYDIMALPDGSIGALMITNLHDIGWNVWFGQPDGTVLVFNDHFDEAADFREPSLFLTSNRQVHAAWLDDREGKRNLYYANFEYATIDPDEFVFINMEEWFDTLTDDEIETTVTWNDASEVEGVVMVLDVMVNGVLEEEFIELDFRIEDIDDDTAKLFISLSFDKSREILKNALSHTIKGYILFDAGGIVPFYFILENHMLLAEIWINDKDSGDGIHDAGVYVQELDETFYTEDGEVMIEFPETGDYHLDISAPGYFPVENYKITIVDYVFDHLYEVGLTIDDIADCEPFEIPHFEDFDELTPRDLPDCWVKMGSGSYSITTEDFNYVSPPNSLNMFHEEESFALLALPEFDADVSELYIDFEARWQFGNNILEVGIIADIADLNSFELIESFNLPEVQEFNNYTVVFKEYDGPEGHIAFRYGSETIETGGGIFMDDMLIDYAEFTLTLSADPPEGGTFEGDGEYKAGEKAILSANPNAGYKFVYWRKDGEFLSSENPYEYTMPAEDVTIIGHFVTDDTDTYDVTIAINDDAWGYATGAGTYLEGDDVIVEAFPNPGYLFVNWTAVNSLDEADNPYEFTMPAENVNLTANFREVISATIDLDYINYLMNWDNDDPVLVITWNDATAVTGLSYYDEDDENWHLLPEEMWDVTPVNDETANFTIFLDESPDKKQKEDEHFLFDQTWRVEFDIGEPAEGTTNVYIKTFLLTFEVEDDDGDPVSGATVTLLPYDGNSNEGEIWDDDNAPEFEVTARGDYEYTIEADGYTSQDGIITNVEEDETITIVLSEAVDRYTLTLVANPTAGGNVSGGGNYEEGKEVTIKATANSGYEFINWTGAVAHIDNPDDETTTLTMPGENITLTANFTEVANIVDEKVFPKIYIFPNPASKKLTIESNELINQVRLIDARGQIVKVLTAESASIEVITSNFKPGIYFIQIQIADGMITERVQIVR